MGSPFLQLPTSEWVASNDLAFAIRDRYPVSPGHTLIIPRREVATWFDATADEQLALIALVNRVKRTLDSELHPDGYNVGFNAGEAAGQTVMHLHVHVFRDFVVMLPTLEEASVMSCPILATGKRLRRMNRGVDR